MDINKPWVIDRHLTMKEREILFLTLSSAGIEIYPDTRRGLDILTYPYICLTSLGTVTGTVQLQSAYTREQVTYEEVMEELTKCVKERQIWT